MPNPFALPGKLSSDLIRLHHYWSGLKRGENKVPFADDVNLSVLPQLKNKLMLIDVFEQPQRFRFNAVGGEIRDAYGADINGKFVDGRSQSAVRLFHGTGQRHSRECRANLLP